MGEEYNTIFCIFFVRYIFKWIFKKIFSEYSIFSLAVCESVVNGQSDMGQNSDQNLNWGSCKEMMPAVEKNLVPLDKKNPLRMCN